LHYDLYFLLFSYDYFSYSANQGSVELDTVDDSAQEASGDQADDLGDLDDEASVVEEPEGNGKSVMNLHLSKKYIDYMCFILIKYL